MIFPRQLVNGPKTRELLVATLLENGVSKFHADMFDMSFGHWFARLTTEPELVRNHQTLVHEDTGILFRDFQFDKTSGEASVEVTNEFVEKGEIPFENLVRAFYAHLESSPASRSNPTMSAVGTMNIFLKKYPFALLGIPLTRSEYIEAAEKIVAASNWLQRPKFVRRSGRRVGLFILI